MNYYFLDENYYCIQRCRGMNVHISPHAQLAFRQHDVDVLCLMDELFH